MRLKEIENFLSKLDISELGLQIEQYAGNTYKLKNINKFKYLLENISEIEIYKEEIDDFQLSAIYETIQYNINVPKENAFKLFHKSNYLINSSSSLKLVFNKLLPKSSEQAISIKLPEPSDFEALNKLMVTIQKSISQVIVNDTIKGSTKVNNWEHGSFWIELILGTQAAVISKKFNENKVLEQTVRAMKLKGDSLDDVLEKQKVMTTALIENEAQSILDKNFQNDDFEQLERLKSSIKTFATLIQDGAEIHPSLVAQEKVQNLFPNFKELDRITSKIPQIEDKTEHNEEADV